MLRLRPYMESDGEKILSWCTDEKMFYQWTAGVLGPYPLTLERFHQSRPLMRFTALEDQEPVGFFTLRNPNESVDEVRFGFVIVNPKLRGKGYGKEMLLLGLDFAREIYKAKRVTLGVFENNLSAYYCYKATGFQDLPHRETYQVMGETWNCRELEIIL